MYQVCLCTATSRYTKAKIIFIRLLLNCYLSNSVPENSRAQAADGWAAILGPCIAPPIAVNA